MLRPRPFGYLPATAVTPCVGPSIEPQTPAQRSRATTFSAIIQMSLCQDYQNENCCFYGASRTCSFSLSLHLEQRDAVQCRNITPRDDLLFDD